MKNPVSKKEHRMERRKKKIVALLEMTRLNDKDRENKQLHLSQMVNDETNLTHLATVDKVLREKSASRKRTCKNGHNSSESTCIRESSQCVVNANCADHAESLVSKRPRLNEDEYARLKQELRERKQRLKAVPRFRLKQVGENASLHINVGSDSRIPIFISDVQHLLLYSLLGNHSPYLPARWCSLEKYNKVTHTVVLVVEGLSSYHFLAYESLFPHIINHLEHRLECVTPAAYGGSVIEDLVAVPLTGTQSSKLIKQFGSLELAFQRTSNVIKLLRTVFPMQKEANDTQKKIMGTSLPVTDKFPRTQLLLSLWQMVEENYPVPLKGELARKYGNYVPTKDRYAEATEKSPMFGLDCEMCLTTSRDRELTRVSVVDESMNVIYDSLVKPDNPIVDYLTPYSGITEKMLQNVTTTLTDVQQRIRDLLPADAILVGQSLNYDLHSLRMMHPYVIDTSVIFNVTGDRYRKTKLQILVQKFLGETIQESTSGHCSTEDSMASLKLTQLKLANSIDYGDAVLLGQCEMEALKTDVHNTKENPALHGAADRTKYGTSIFNHVIKDKNTAAIVGNGEVLNEYSRYIKSSSLNVMDDENFDSSDQVRLVIAESNRHAICRTAEVAIEHGFTLCHVKIEETQLKDEHIERTLNSVNKWIYKLWQRTAVHGLVCVVFTGQNNAANGACFLDVKKDVPLECVLRG